MRSKTSPRYPRGITPSGRRRALAAQLALLQKALAPWPRRHAPLLEINCGNGAFLPFLWNCGFDAQGVEADFGLRQTALRRNVPGLEVHAASDTALPFDNDSFDWVILHLQNRERHKDSALEAARLAKRGLLLTFWNTTSLAALCWRLAHKTLWSASATSSCAVSHLLKAQNSGRVTVLSTLFLPACWWKGRAEIMPSLAAIPLGAWCVGRLDFGNSAPITPMALRLGAPMAPGPAPALEYAQKRGTAISSQSKGLKE